MCLVYKKRSHSAFYDDITFSVMCITLIYCQILTTITFELSVFFCVRCIDKTFFTGTFPKLEVFLSLRTHWNLNTKFQKTRLWQLYPFSHEVCVKKVEKAIFEVFRMINLTFLRLSICCQMEHLLKLLECSTEHGCYMDMTQAKHFTNNCKKWQYGSLMHP